MSRLPKRLHDRETPAPPGFRDVLLRLHDPADEAYVAECRRTATVLADDGRDNGILDWIEANADTEGWR